ncbi:MAG: peptide chain release factor N(5)-glutamine methyltransferase [Spirulina sp. SIO3F2]|nr:peptide chain release factor N(5)-glutamine methyltransferase [Spirulina sp. SIO3F2]
MPTYSVQAILQWRLQAQASAVAHQIPPYEVDVLLCELGGVERLSLVQKLPHELLNLSLSLPELAQCWQQRLDQRQPLQHLIGYTAWRQWTIQVSPDVLIPRPETEQIVDIVATTLKNSALPRTGHWVDLGTGSGILACGLAQLLPEATIHAVDCSEAALAIAQKNITQLGFEQQITLYSGNWWQPLTHLQGQVQGMVANPPYIPTAAIDSLQPEVRDHEPAIALDGGSDGLQAIHQVMHSAPDYLRPGGLWLIELMQGQAPQVLQWLAQHPAYAAPEAILDWSGTERFVLAWRRREDGSRETEFNN